MKDLKIREIFVENLLASRTISLRAEAGYRLKSLKQRVSEFEFPVEDGIDKGVATELVIKSELEGLRVLIPTKGKWMKTFTDTFVFQPDAPGVGEFKIVILRKESHAHRPMKELPRGC